MTNDKAFFYHAKYSIEKYDVFPLAYFHQTEYNSI